MVEKFLDCVGKPLEDNFYLFRKLDGTTALSYVFRSDQEYRASLFDGDNKEVGLTLKDAKNLIPTPESIVKAVIKRNPNEAERLEELLAGIKLRKTKLS